ncbi:hypothetical protein ACIBG4_37120 [Nonomuraea sp. NPDC050383]
MNTVAGIGVAAGNLMVGALTGSAVVWITLTALGARAACSP